MFDRDSWQEIWITITRNKFRSFLTGVGVLWGIFMLICLLAIANGFRGGIFQLVDGFDKNSCYFIASITSEPYKGYKKGRYWNLTNKDISMIRQKAKSVDEICPGLIDLPAGNNVVRDNQYGSFTLRGVYPALFSIEQQNILYGRLLNEVDMKYDKKVCVIGKEVYEALFQPGEDPTGQHIRIKGFSFIVVGVVSPISQITLGADTQLTVFVPFSTMQRLFWQGDVVHYIACTAKPGYMAQYVEDEVKALLQEAHTISPTDEKAMICFNAESEYLTFQKLFEGVDILIWIVGMGSLLSGVIGVTNIMLVTIRERTREIGIKRALGARPYLIVRQIMSESFVLTSFFGLSGLIMGVWLLDGAQREMARHPSEDVLFLPPYITLNVAVAAFIILCVAGLLAGLIPSLRALSIKPIDAIREE